MPGGNPNLYNMARPFLTLVKGGARSGRRKSVAALRRIVQATLETTAMLRHESALILGQSMEAVATSRSRLQDTRERLAHLTGRPPPARFGRE